MKKWLVAAIIAAGVLIYFWLRAPEKSTPAAPAAADSAGTAPVRVISPAPATNRVEPAGATSSIESPALASNAAPALPPISVPSEFLYSPTSAPPSLPPLTLLENMRTAIRNYGATYGGNPVGNNAEITRALLGENPKQIVFLKADAGQRINSNGELVDAWGTPYFFHQLSGEDTEIRSAGPDRQMWTGDDLVIH